VDYIEENYEDKQDDNVQEEYNEMNPNEIYVTSRKKSTSKMKSHPIQHSQQNQKNPNRNQKRKRKNYLKK
jgi:hypothetical protein